MVKRGRDRKAEELAKSRTLNPHPEAVLDAAFASSEFFDAADLVQVKYEMVRRVEVEGIAVNAASRTASGCGFSVLDFASSSAFRSRPRFTIRPPPVECPDYYAFSDTESAADTPSP